LEKLSYLMTQHKTVLFDVFLTKQQNTLFYDKTLFLVVFNIKLLYFLFFLTKDNKILL
jgi:hypothetical protein